MYARVSSGEQKTKGDLDRQAIEVLEGFTGTIKNPVIMSELENMIEEKGQETINKIFTEYFMVTVSKAMKCDRLAEALEDKNCTIEQLKEILYE